MKIFKTIRNSKGMINIGMAMGVAMVVATFMAPLGLYYLNMYNESEKARLRTQANEVIEGLGKLIYNAYATAPLDPAAGCPSGENVQLTMKQVTLGGSNWPNKSMIYMQSNKNMGGLVSGQPAPTTAPSGTTIDPSKVRMCLPSDGMICQELLGREYCVDFTKMEIAKLDSEDSSSPEVAEVSVKSKDPNFSLWDQLRWKTAPLAARTAQWMDKVFHDKEAYPTAYAQGLESFGTTVNSPGLHSPIVTSSNFAQARLSRKRCQQGANSDPASLAAANTNHCVSCSENSVVCVRYSLCMEPGTGVTEPAQNQEDCDPGQFMQGMVAMFPDRI